MKNTDNLLISSLIVNLCVGWIFNFILNYELTFFKYLIEIYLI